MGRIAGVTAAETRERLLRAAADVFAERGYDGTRVADIAAAAGVSNGALYAHFGSKAELLVAALRAHGRQLLAELFAADPDRPITDLLARHRPVAAPPPATPRGYLIVEALVAARRDEEVPRPMRDYVGERADWLAELVRVAQGGGELDPALSPDGAGPLLPAAGDGQRARSRRTCTRSTTRSGPRLLTRIVTALAPDRHHRTDGSSAVKVQINSERCQGHGRCYDLAPGPVRRGRRGLRDGPRRRRRAAGPGARRRAWRWPTARSSAIDLPEES